MYKNITLHTILLKIQELRMVNGDWIRLGIVTVQAFSSYDKNAKWRDFVISSLHHKIFIQKALFGKFNQKYYL